MLSALAQNKFTVANLHLISIPIFYPNFAKISTMNLHEYQSKELLKKYNVPVQEGIPVDSAGSAEEAYKNLKVQYGNSFAVVKAQIHAGGRGKGKIEGTEQRGVAVGKSAEEIKQI